MTTTEIVGLVLQIVATLLGWLFERNKEKKEQKAEAVKAIANKLSTIQEAINEGDESAFNATLGDLHRSRK